MAEEKRPTLQEAGAWYDDNVDCHARYAKCVHDLLEILLGEERLPYHSITYRVKARKSFLDKYENKPYEAPGQITDVAALRIIAYTTADVNRICALVEKELEIDRENSVNKASQLDSDRVGYLSVHYIASLTRERAALGEYRAYGGMKCEIQVRTLLQHAWAEIEHDRSYKFSGDLPKEIKRRFYLLAGVLELADREFQGLSDAIDAYGKQVAEDTEEGRLDIPIDSISLTEFMRQKFPALEMGQYWGEGNPKIVEELQGMDIHTLADLEAIIPPELVEKITEAGLSNYTGALRDVMIIHDGERYFEKAWNGHWQFTDQKRIDFWRENGVDVEYLKDWIEIEPLEE